MNKIISFFVLALGMVLAAGCSDDTIDNPYAKTSSIVVDSADVIFQAAPSTGSITVTAPNGITDVKTSSSWCTAEVSGNVVKINVAQNNSYEGRSSMVTIYSGQDYTEVNVQQLGFILQLESGSADNSIKVNTDDAQSLAFYMKHNTDVQFSSTADWLKTTVTDDSLKVSLDANTTGVPRAAWLHYSSGNIKDSLLVSQFDIKKDILGDYKLYYYSSGWKYYNVEMYEKSAGKYALKFKTGSFANAGFEIPIYLREDYPGVYFNNLDPVGKYTSKGTEYDVITMVMYLSGNSIYRTRDTELRADGVWNYEDGVSYFTFNSDNYLDAGNEFYGLRLSLTTDGTYNGYKSALITFTGIQLEKVNAE